jgi:hypothetical protein
VKDLDSLKSSIHILFQDSSVQQAIHLVKQNEIQRLPTFLPDPKHPLYDTISHISPPIPSTLDGKPDLLLHELPITITQEQLKELSQHPDIQIRPITRNILLLTKKFNEKGGPGSVALLIGVSGCGKTRSIYEVMSVHFGLYFTSSVGGNGGADDVESLCTLLKASPTLSDKLADHYANCLLLARLMVFLHFLNNCPKINPYQWLLLQIKPAQFLRLKSGNNIFTELATLLIAAQDYQVLQQVQSYLKIIYPLKGAFLTFIDEAQVVTFFVIVDPLGFVALFGKSIFGTLIPDGRISACFF